MKPKISPEVDRLMWLVAEENSSKAISDFGDRFPDLRGELGRRLEMVRSLRGARNKARTVEVPAFRPRTAPAAPRMTMRLAFAAAAVAFAAIGFGTYAVISSSKRASAPAPSAISTEMPTIPPAVQYADQLPAPQPTETPVVPQNVPNKIPDYMQAQNFEFHGTKLDMAIRMIATAGHFDVEIGPGLDNVDVTTNYGQLTPVEALKKLGQDYGFTAFAEERGRVLIIPAKDGIPADPSASPSDLDHTVDSQGANNR